MTALPYIRDANELMYGVLLIEYRASITFGLTVVSVRGGGSGVRGVDCEREAEISGSDIPARPRS
jgi:hypothetical protein